MPAAFSNLFGQPVEYPEAQTPGMGPIGQLKQWNQNNPGVLAMIGAGMMQGDTGGGFARAGALQVANQRDRREAEERKYKSDATLRYLMAQGMSEDEARAAADAGLAGEALRQREVERRAQNPGVPNFGLNPFLFKDKDGRTRAAQLNDQGGWQELDLGEGSTVLDPYEKSRMGAEGREVGKGTGEAAVTYRNMTSKLPGLQTVVKELDALADKATYTWGGKAWNEVVKQSGYGSTEGAIARQEYNAKVSNQILPWLRDTFGAQFTVSEGEWLRSTLGSDSHTPQEKKAILRAFIDQKVRDIEALGAASQGGETTVPAPNGGGDGWVDKGNGVRVRRKN